MLIINVKKMKNYNCLCQNIVNPFAPKRHIIPKRSYIIYVLYGIN